MSLDKKFITLQRKAERMSRMGENTVARNYKKLLDELRITMGRMYQEYEIDGQLTFEEMTKYDRLQKLDKKVYELITDLYKANTNVVRGTLGGIAKDAYDSSVAIVEGSTQKKLKGIIKPLDVGKTINNEMAGLKWTERMGKHRVDAIYEVKKEIKLGLTQGDTYGTMAKRLKGTLETDVKKANTIVRTEGHRVHAQAKKDSLDSIAKHGVKMTKKWLSGQDERVRSQHAAMNGVEIPYEDDFVMPDGVKGPSPGLIGQPQHDINCRCIITMDIVTGESSKGLSSDGSSSEPDEPIYVEKLDKVDYDIAKGKLIEYEREIVNKEFENAYVILKDGEVYRFEGEKATVNPLGLGDKLKGSYVTHNHPENETYYSFSDADVGMFLESELGVLRGVDDKFSYQITKLENTIKAESDIVRNEFKTEGYMMAVNKAFLGEIDMSVDEYHEAVKYLAEKYNFMYVREENE